MMVCAGLLWQLPFVIWSSYIAPSLFHSSETCSYSLIAQAVAYLTACFLPLADTSLQIMVALYQNRRSSPRWLQIAN